MAPAKSTLLRFPRGRTDGRALAPSAATTATAAAGLSTSGGLIFGAVTDVVACLFDHLNRGRS